MFIWFVFVFFICTLLNEGDKSETEIGAYKRLGFCSICSTNVIFVSM